MWENHQTALMMNILQDIGQDQIPKDYVDHNRYEKASQFRKVTEGKKMSVSASHVLGLRLPAPSHTFFNAVLGLHVH